MDIQRYNK